MEPVLFYGVPEGCSFGSIVALEWLGAPYRLCRCEMPADLQAEPFARVNAVRETPALMLETGETISESVAILNHIAAKGVNKGIGFRQGTIEFDRLNQALGYLNTTFFSAFSPLWLAFEMEENPPVQTILRDIGRRNVLKAFGQIEEMLADRAWLAGTPDKTVADAYFIGVARWGEFHQVFDRKAFSRVDKLMKALEAGPAVIFAHAIENARPAATAGGFKGHVTMEELAPRLAA